MQPEDAINDRSATVAIVGMGYVGLPLAGAFHDAGFRVMGFDIDPPKIEALREDRPYIEHLGSTFSQLAHSDRFDPTDDFSRLGEPDAILVCVPTPLAHEEGRDLDPDLSYVEQTADQVADTLRAGQLVVLESTTYPGTTREVVLPRLEATGLRAGDDFLLAYSPEREDPGRTDRSTRTIPKLVGGIDERSTRAAAGLYRQAVHEVIEVDSPEVAEASKLLENIFRAVNIALVNELKVTFEKMGIDVWKVIDAASTKPFGFMRFEPGPGLGGHCIPIDPFYLSWKAKQHGADARFIELAGQVNRAMPDYVVARTVSALSEQGTLVQNARVLVLGLAYKPDVDDVRESPALVLIEKLKALGATVDYNDPHVPATHAMRQHDLKMTSVALTPEALAGYDAVLVATNHKAYDPQMIADHAKLVIDTRGMMRGVQNPKATIVVA